MSITLALILGFVVSIGLISLALGELPGWTYFLGIKRHKKWQKTIKQRRDNEREIQSRYSELKNAQAIRSYILLNQHNLPQAQEWQGLLEPFITELIENGWKTEDGVYTKLKYGEYQITIGTKDPETYAKANAVVKKYLELSLDSE